MKKNMIKLLFAKRKAKSNATPLFAKAANSIRGASQNPGVTLIEVLLYVALSSIVILSALDFYSGILSQKLRLGMSKSTLDSGQFTLQKILRQIDAATAIMDISSNEICLEVNSPDYSYVKIVNVNDSSVYFETSDQSDCSSPISTSRISDSAVNMDITLEDYTLPLETETKTIRVVLEFSSISSKFEALPGGNSKYSLYSTARIRT